VRRVRSLIAVHLAERFDLPAGYAARPYRGPADHPAMVAVLAAHRSRAGDTEMPTVEQMNHTYSLLQACDPATDVAVVEHGGEVVAYGRGYREVLGNGTLDCVVFAPVHPDHLAEPLVAALARGLEAHEQPWAAGVGSARYRAYAVHPGPGQPAVGEAAWLEALGYQPTEWEASLVRPHLEDIPERPLPDGVEVRPVTADQLRPILEAHLEAFRGEWDFREPTEADIAEMLDDPCRDETLWQVAWAGDQVVGQVKPFVNPEENAARGYRRGYTEYISTHRDWRGRGIAGALLARSLQELKRRGMTEAALGVDTNNPGGAFRLYTGLGFVLQRYEVVYTKPVPGAGAGPRRPWPIGWSP
jgi:ribosomal protein S18 acetylase RimI-like enzyme